MSNPPSAPTVKFSVPAGLLLRLKETVFGIATDFWKDGTDNPFAFLSGLKLPPTLTKLSLSGLPTALSSAVSQDAAQHAAIKRAEAEKARWHAEPGEISEKMWGNGFVTPGSALIADLLIKPLGLTKEMNVLDLSAGLGSRMRYLTEKCGSYVMGLEPDAEIAARGMELSKRAGKSKHDPIAHYDPSHFSLPGHYDCVLANELFYRVPDPTAFFTAIGSCTKPGAQLAFTDYIVDSENRAKPAIMAWCASEKNATPMGLVEMAEVWAKVGFHLRVHEDLSDFYKKEVIKGLKRFTTFLATGAPPDAETKKMILHRLSTWMHRLAAMEQGMKFYRFYGTKN